MSEHDTWQSCDGRRTMPTAAPLPPPTPPMSDAELARIDWLIARMNHDDATGTEWRGYDLANATPRMLGEIRRLRAALAGWKCDRCKGERYRVRHDGRLSRVDLCDACAGSGLHPAARAALGDEAGATDARSPRHNPYDGPCPTCGFQMRRVEREPFRFPDEDEDAGAGDENGGTP